MHCGTLTAVKKQLVVTLVRVSTEEQDLERQRQKVKTILLKFNLGQLREFELKVSGTVVEKTTEYREMLTLLQRRDVVGLVVPSIDRWFRYKLVSELGRYVEPFEEMFEGSPNKRLFCNLGNLDLRNREDQDKILDAARYASKEREVIAERFNEGKDRLRGEKDTCIERRPRGVGFKRFDEDENKGEFVYEPFAFEKVRPVFYRYLEGESLYTLAREYGYSTVTALRFTLQNEWWIGIKHRTQTVKTKVWNEEKNRYSRKDRASHPDPIRVETNLAKTPLVPVKIFEAVRQRLKQKQTEWEQHTDLEKDCLVSGIFRCSKCGAKMYYRQPTSNRDAVYVCSTRHRGTKAKCDEPRFKAKPLEDEVALQAVFYLTNEEFVQTKLRESMNEDHIEAAKAKVSAKENIVAEIQKRYNSRGMMAEQADDPTPHMVRLNELSRELASAKADLRTAEQEVTDIPDADVETMARQIRQDLAGFASQPMVYRKAILKKYIQSITATKHPVTDALTVKFQVKINAPAVPVFEYEKPTSPRPKPTNGSGKATPIRVVKGGTTGGAPPLPCTKIKRIY